MNILALFQCLQCHVTATTLRHLSRIALAMLVMPGRVTMLGLSRWAGKGGSYRTIQRFFSQALPWAMLFWVFFRQHVHRPDEVYLLVGDEVVVTKAGKHTYGLDRFFSSLYGKPIPGLAFFAFSLVSVQARHSFPLRVEQVVRSDAEKAARKAKAEAKKQKPSTDKRPRGRPKGSKNTNQTEAPLTPELGRITAMLDALLHLIAGFIPLTYLVLDGHFGNHNALHMARQANLHLISKLRYDAALYFPSTGPYAGRGPHRKYGDKVDYDALPVQYLQDTTVAGHMQTCLYQMQLLHKEFTQPLNVVIIVKTNLRTQARAHVVLFSSDVALAYAPLVDYYGLRFQIEFNFRDAKQSWGLEDCMNVTPTGVTNAANLSLFMVNVAYRLRADGHPRDPPYSVLDLKADCRGHKYVEETIKMLPEKPEPVLFAKILNQVASLGRIHAAQPSFSFS
ncbi:MAG TPA: transposase [Candidatus Saccharimonadia bacterium]|nr:transposase [Candidatus Saccharimonadia bacterium]